MTLSDAQLVELERRLEIALERRSVDGLQVLGFGESSIAIAWPHEQPTHVAKRLVAVKSEAGVAHARETIERYIRQISPHADVAPTEIRAIRNDRGWYVPYLVQPLYERDQLVEHVLASETPSATHPIVVAMRRAVVESCADGRQALDAQFNNFAWVDERLVLFDVGTPFLFDEHGRSELEFGEMLRVMPAVLRPLARRKIARVIESMGSKRDSYRQAAMSLVRSDLSQWLAAVVEAFNEELEDPISEAEIHQRVAELHEESRSVKKLLRLERWWSTRVRRRPYDMFITDSFTGEVQ